MIPLSGILAGTAAAASLTVNVQGDGSTPIESAEILVINPYLEATRSMTNASGTARFDGLPTGIYRIHVNPPDGDPHTPQYHPGTTQYCDADQIEIGPDATTVDMELPVGDWIEGTLFNSASTPIAGVRLRAQSNSSGGTRDAWSSEDGRFRIGGLEPGESWWVQAAITGRPVQWWGQTVEQDDSPPIDPALTPLLEPWTLLDGVTVEGTVTGPEGPVADASVRVYSNSQIVITDTDSDGNYSANGLPVGDMTTWAAAEGLAVTYLGDADRPDEFIALTSDGDTETGVDIDMPMEARVEVQLTGSAPLTGGDLEGISVVLYNDAHTVGRGEQTDSSGTAVFAGLHGGAYELFVYGSTAGHADDWMREADGTISRLTVLDERETGPVTIPMTPSHTVHGSVVDEHGIGIRGAMVIISEEVNRDSEVAESGGLFVETTDADGFFSTSGVPPGVWKIRAQTSPVCPTDPGHVPVYWPDEADPLMADTLTILETTDATTQVRLVMPSDNDHDEMGDRWERRHGLDTEADDALEDPDGDGLNNLTEYRMRTDPFEAAGYWVIERSCGCSSGSRRAPIAVFGWILGLVLVRRRAGASQRRSALRGR